MKFVEIDSIPKTGDRFPYKRLRDIFDEFMNMNIKLARVDSIDNEYKNSNVAYAVLYNGIKKYGYPINIYLRNALIYLERKDI